MREAFHIPDCEQKCKPWVDPKKERKTKDEEKKVDPLLARHSDGVRDCFVGKDYLRLRRGRLFVVIQFVIEGRHYNSLQGLIVACYNSNFIFCPWNIQRWWWRNTYQASYNHGNQHWQLCFRKQDLYHIRFVSQQVEVHRFICVSRMHINFDNFFPFIGDPAPFPAGLHRPAKKLFTFLLLSSTIKNKSTTNITTKPYTGIVIRQFSCMVRCGKSPPESPCILMPKGSLPWSAVSILPSGNRPGQNTWNTWNGYTRNNS